MGPGARTLTTLVMQSFRQRTTVYPAYCAAPRCLASTCANNIPKFPVRPVWTVRFSKTSQIIAWEAGHAGVTSNPIREIWPGSQGKHGLTENVFALVAGMLMLAMSSDMTVEKTCLGGSEQP